ncbi:hypothetical protein SLEP1_g53688 [Rubroshorea leprosula]|uniref:Mitotic spindle assembly checkpoint protein MAD1 n=1 Tax=Rubroshorea leprosula TaxID=152421 RepID=A0AAV5MAK7_9ROSI|nr:hypothetical protein SLEP1_g53688 [Rubroshorea leprosula]
MILRTPPPKKRRGEAIAAESPPPPSDRRLVIYDHNPPPVPPDSSDQFLCTYQCRQMVKADFVDALTTAEKQLHDYQSKLEALNQNLSKAEAESKKFRDQFLYTEQELVAAKRREQVLQEQLLKELNDSQQRFRKQLQSYNELEDLVPITRRMDHQPTKLIGFCMFHYIFQLKLQNEMNLREKAESSAESADGKATLLERKLSQLSESIEREKRHLSDELAQTKSESKLSISRINADLERMKCKAKNAEEESELLKEQLEGVMKQFNECLHQKSEVEKKLSSFTLQDVTPTENNPLIKHLQEELRNYESEVQEARKLKSSHENIELLKEKLLEEKGRKERAELQLSKLQELQLSLNNLENELSSWKLMMKDIPGVSCHEDIPVKFATLQKEVIDSTMKMGEANARLKQMEVSLDLAQLGKQNAEAEAALAKEKAEVLKSEIKRIELMLSMVTDERDKFRSIINELKKPKNEEMTDEAANMTIVQELELSLVNKEFVIKELENSLCQQKELNDRQHNEIRLLNERLNDETRRIKSLEREGDRLCSEISLLESKLGHGDFSSANTKVLRMVNTLALGNDAKQTIEALQTELQKTKERLQAVEELKSQSGDTGKLVDSYISEKILKLKEQIATLEKREERVLTCISLSTQQANNYTSQPEISRQIEIFIRKMNSIPAFTANLTVESFNRRTLS